MPSSRPRTQAVLSTEVPNEDWKPIERLTAVLDRLGEREARFIRTEKREQYWNYALAIVALLAGLIFVPLMLYQGLKERKNLGVWLCIGIFNLLIGLGGLWALFELRKKRELRVLIYPRALVRVDGLHFLVLPWDQVKELYQSIANVYQYGVVYSGQEYGFQLVRNDGKSLFINEGIDQRDIGRLSDILQGKVAERLLPRVRAQFRSGEPVAFGPLTISSTGVSNGKETIPWREITGVKVAQGIITVRKRGKWFDWSRVSASAIPNLYVFLSLINEIVGINE